MNKPTLRSSILPTSEMHPSYNCHVKPIGDLRQISGLRTIQNRFLLRTKSAWTAELQVAGEFWGLQLFTFQHMNVIDDECAHAYM